MDELIPRRTECTDAPSITSLIKPSTTSLFGRVQVLDMIEKANLAITLNKGDSSEILGHAAFCDYPNITGVSNSNWEQWMSSNFDLPVVTALNSLFLHLLVTNDNKNNAIGEIFRTTFTTLVSLQYVWLLAPSDVKLDLAFKEHFVLVDAAKGATPSHALYVTQRHQHFPMLHIRDAKVEDHDDLTPVFNHCTGKLEQQYGDYFIAELIEAQDESHRTIVADVNGRGVGFVSVTTEVDLDLLNTCFHLAPYHGLHKPSNDDEIISVEGIVSQPSSSVSIISNAMHAEASQIIATAANIHPTTNIASDSSHSNSDKQSNVVDHVINEQPEVIVQTTTSSTSSIVMEQQQQQQQPANQLLTTQPLTVDHSNITSGPSSTYSNQQTSNEAIKPSATPPDQATLHDSSAISHDSHPSSHDPKALSHDRQVLSHDSAPPTVTEHQYVYQGGSNVICIQLFCMDEAYEMRSRDLLPGIFQCFPDKDMLALMQPHNHSEFPLLTNFTRVTPRANSVLSQELFVFHKCALIESLTVRMVKSSDIEQVELLCRGIDGSNQVMADVKQYLVAKRDPTNEGATPICCVVAECVDQIVGVCVLRQEEAIQYIRAHYNIEDFVYFNCHRPEQHGHLYHLLLNPIFSCHCKHFIKEVLRHSHMTCLYYPLYQQGLSPRPHLLPSHLSVLVSVRPRKQIDYPHKELDINAPMSNITNEIPPFALYHTSRKLSLEPKVMVNHRIVVVGASDTSLAFLEALVFCPHLQFNNLLLVSPNGILAPCSHDSFLPNTHCHDRNSYYHQSLHTWVNVVHGTMTKIDREEKCITVHSEHRSVLIHYDQLLLCTGTQYTTAIGPAPPTKGVVTINNSVQAKSVTTWTANHPTATPIIETVLIYGSSLSAYTAVEGLLNESVAADRIIMVQPHPPTCFNNSIIEDHVSKTLSNIGVRVIVGYDITSYDVEGNTLKGVMLSNKEEDMKINCSLVVCLHCKQVDTSAFRAINHACLVFDHRLVVDTLFHTNDPNIFAAGPLTKYSRSYHSEWSHSNYSAKEVGQKLAMTILTLFDPSFQLPSSPTEQVLPSYNMAKVQAGVIAGGLHYLHLDKPHPGNQPMTDPHDHEVLVTENDDNEYFRISIDQYDIIDSITCLSKTPFEVTNYLNLYGVNEKCVNNLLARFQKKLIPDLYSFLREPWSLAIYHDRFSDLQQEIVELLRTPLGKDGPSLEDKIRQLTIDCDYRLSEDQKHNILQLFTHSPASNALEQKLLHYLNHNHYHLPMYARPQLL